MNISDLIICQDISSGCCKLWQKKCQILYTELPKFAVISQCPLTKLLIYHGKIYSLFHPSVYLMYEMNLIQHALTYMTMCNLYMKRVYILHVLLYNTI